jgi:hypothetical protein
MTAVPLWTLNLDITVSLVGNNDACIDLLLEDYLVLDVTIMRIHLVTLSCLFHQSLSNRS